MRKDLWIGAMTAMIVHSGIVLFSLIQPLRPLHHSTADTTTAMVPITAPPELVEPPDDTPVEKEHVDAPPAPSLPDLPSPRINSVFVDPIRPTPPPTSNIAISILPTGLPVGHDNGIRIFDPADLSQPPIATSTPNPLYPFELRRSGVEGKAVVDFIVDEHGTVLRPYALEGTQADFGRAAVEGVRRWHFRPGIKDGQAVRTHMQIPIEFSLQK